MIFPLVTPATVPFQAAPVTAVETRSYAVDDATGVVTVYFGPVGDITRAKSATWQLSPAQLNAWRANTKAAIAADSAVPPLQ